MRAAAVSTAIGPAAHTLAPETGTAVRAAQDALEREATHAEAVNDPAGPTLRAVSLALGACHRLYVDGSLTMARLAQDFRSKPPIEKDEMRLSILNGIRATDRALGPRWFFSSRKAASLISADPDGEHRSWDGAPGSPTGFAWPKIRAWPCGQKIAPRLGDQVRCTRRVVPPGAG